jgi:translation initiation factor IF-3
MVQYNRFESKTKNYTRINFQIRAGTVRVVQDGNQVGIMPTEKARSLAQDAGLDLVEIVPHANPPVCHIIDFNKYRYQQKQREKEQQKKQREAIIDQKEVRLRPCIQENDVQTKILAIKKFLTDGKKVQLTLTYKNREITHKEEGLRVVNQILQAVAEESITELSPRFEGSRLICRLQPKKD